MLFILSVRFSPYIVFALPLFLIMSQLRLIGNRTAIVFVYIIINLPVVVLSLLVNRQLRKGFAGEMR